MRVGIVTPKNGAAMAKYTVRQTIWYIVSVSANSVDAHAAHRGGDAAEHHGVDDGKDGADAEAVGAGGGDQQHAAEADQQRRCRARG